MPLVEEKKKTFPLLLIFSWHKKVFLMLFVALLGKVIVFSPYPLLPDDFPHAVEESPVPWVGGPLIVDELDLNGLHGGDGEDCLAHSGAQPAQQSCAGREHAVVVSHVLLEELEGSESDS